MAALSHQSFANTDTPYWASAVEPATMTSPLTVVDSIGVPTRKLQLTAGSNTSSLFYSDMAGTDVVGIEFVRNDPPFADEINFDVGNVNYGLSIRSSEIVARLPVSIQTISATAPFTITQTPSNTILRSGAVGTQLTMSNVAGGPIRIGTSLELEGASAGLMTAISGPLQGTYDHESVTYLSGGSLVGTVGASGTSMYLNTAVTPAERGLRVNRYNGCEITCRDATANDYTIQSTSGQLTVSAPSLATAITVAPSGTVTIPDLISSSSVPIGGIIMYSGSLLAIPVNYRVCDGTLGTPDLRNRFILGEGTLAQGATGGSTTISTSQLPAHNHGITDPGHSHNVVLTGLFNNGDSGSAITYVGQSLTGGAGNRVSDPGAAQTTTTGISTTNTGSGDPYFQPYFVLTFIIRVS